LPSDITSRRSIEYNKKKDKKASIKFVKDPSARTDDVYKSSTVTVGQGEPPTSGMF
jgi:myosin-1